MLILAHDFETTGVDTNTCGVVQTAILMATLDDQGNWEVTDKVDRLSHPGCPIPDGASKVHGIYDKDVAGTRVYTESVPELYRTGFALKPELLVGYNSRKYDDKILSRLMGWDEVPVKQFDLIIPARRLKAINSDLANAKLSTVYEYLMGREAENAHNALADVTMTLELIRPLMALLAPDLTIEEFIEWCDKPMIDPQFVVGFGKHKGTRMGDLPRGYLRWMSEQAFVGEDVQATANAILSGRC